MADYGAVAIRDANRLASGVASGCATKVTAGAGGEVEVLLWRADGQMAVPADKTPASAGDGGCTAGDAMAAHHKARSAEAGGCMADGTIYVAGDAAAEVGCIVELAELAN